MSRPTRLLIARGASIGILTLASLGFGMLDPPDDPSADSPAGGPLLGPEGCESLALPPVVETQFISVARFDTSQSPHFSAPDANGDVSSAWVVTATNEGVRTHDRTGAVIDTKSLSEFWAPAGPRNQVNDPRILYSRARDRWVAVAVTRCRNTGCGPGETEANTSRLLMATTSGSNPAFANWTYASIDPDPNSDEYWADFPTVGLNRDWIVVAINMVGPDIRTALRVCAWDDLDTALLHKSVGFDTVGGYYGHIFQPCVHVEDDPPEVVYIVDQNPQYDHAQPSCAECTGNGVWHRQYRVSRVFLNGQSLDWEIVGSGDGLLDLTCAAEYEAFNCFYGMTNCSLGCNAAFRISNDHFSNAVFRGGHIWTCQTGQITGCAEAGQSRVFNFGIDPTAEGGPQLDVCDRIPDPDISAPGETFSQAWPSIAVNCAGDICIGFTRLAGSQCPGPRARAFVRLANGDANEINLKNSADCMTDSGSVSLDYSATVVDPADDLAFWTIQVYAKNVNGTACCDAATSTWASIWTKLISSP